MNASSSTPPYPPYFYDFICTYPLLVEEDADMANFLYKIQLADAFGMQKNLMNILRDDNPNTNPFQCKSVQDVFDYLLDVMHIHRNKKFVDVIRKHPLLLNIQNQTQTNTDDNLCENVDEDGAQNENDTTSYEPYHKHNEKNDKRLVKDGLLWLISFDSFHAFHKCMIDIFTSGNAQLISDENLKCLERTFDI